MATSEEKISELLAMLRQVLEDERSALLAGSPERIASVVERKLALAERIANECLLPEALRASADTVRQLDRYNRGNGAICSVMLRHLTQAVDHLHRRELHRSYGPDGAESRPPTQNPLGAA